jgi:hypothetical protein
VVAPGFLVTGVVAITGFGHSAWIIRYTHDFDGNLIETAVVNLTSTTKHAVSDPDLELFREREWFKSLVSSN